jgi:uncharacterized membrane protein YozB (DUF420 family)
LILTPKNFLAYWHHKSNQGENLAGIFGTNAVLITDLNLLVQIASFVLILAALVYKDRGKFKIHGSLMGVAVLLHFITFLVAMGPSFIEGFSFLTSETTVTGVQTLWVHAIIGAVSLVLGIFLIVVWIPKASNIKPCFGRKRLMDATAVTWTISLAFGIATYIAFYI